ncbi:MAG: DUF6279 family lipoprotein [SAR86 cluster bacterium]|nr:DUF6279 family lipoprotein [SAR86 cluster bacterium]
MKKKLKIYVTISSLLILSSCTVAGSWVYERADSFLADYFKEYANFSNQQKDEIDKVTENYLDWFTRNELPVIRAVLVDLKEINNSDVDNLIKETYKNGQELFERSNKYFEKSFIKFFKTLTDLQVDEIKNHFEEIQVEREESRKEEKIYSEEVIENYISGFRRLNIKLTKAQKDYVKENIKGLKNIRSEWSFFQEKWVEELIEILNKRNDQDFDKRITAHLKALENLGDEEFQLKRKNNEQIGIKIISGILSNASEKQIKGAKRRIDTYIASIDRILSNRSLD